jgi:hypothetical protein
MRGLGKHGGTALGVRGHVRTGALAMRRSDHAGSPSRIQRAVQGGISLAGNSEPCSRREGRPLSLLCLLRGFACGPFPSWFILTRSPRRVGVRTFQCRRPFTRRRLRGFPSFGPFSASPREPVAALNRMAMAKQSSAMATRTSPPRSLEGDA